MSSKNVKRSNSNVDTSPSAKKTTKKQPPVNSTAMNPDDSASTSLKKIEISSIERSPKADDHVNLSSSDCDSHDSENETVVREKP